MTQLALDLRPDEVDPTRRRKRIRRHLRPVRSGEQLDWPSRSWRPRRPRRLPATRRDCLRVIQMDRYAGCPFVSCRHHLWSDRLDEFERMVDRCEPSSGERLPATCSLDVAEAVDAALPGSVVAGVGALRSRKKGSEDGTMRLVDVGRHLGISGERARQLQRSALEAAGRSQIVAEIAGLDWFGDE